MSEYRVTTDEGAFWRDDTAVFTSGEHSEDVALECWLNADGLESLDLDGGTLYVYVLNEDKGAYAAYAVYFDEDDFVYTRAWERDLDPL